jgi:hypothetical protein
MLKACYIFMFSAQEMSGITKSFRLGFGAFVDKPLAPYIDTFPTV